MYRDGKKDAPGVSMMLMLYLPSSSGLTLSLTFQSAKVAADWIVMPFSRSSSIESILAPTPSRPRTSWIADTRPV